jgi:hypothetical protein
VSDPFGRGEESGRDPFGGGDARWLPPAAEGAPPPAPAGSAPTHGKATTAMVLGIVGIAFCPLICSVPAIVIGTRARREIDASAGRLGGRAQATSGIVLGWVGAALVVGFLLLVLLGAVADDGGSGGGTVTIGDLK